MAGQGGLAEQVRTGLTQSNNNKPKLTVISKKQISDPLDELSFRKPIRQHLREFGAILAIICLVIAGVKLYRQSDSLIPYYYIGAASIFLFFGYIAQRAFYPIWKLWMKLAVILGLFMTTLIVGIAWVVMLVPMALIMKMFGKKTMDLRYRTNVPTYWEERDPKLNDFKLLERQF